MIDDPELADLRGCPRCGLSVRAALEACPRCRCPLRLSVVCETVLRENGVEVVRVTGLAEADFLLRL